MLSELVVRTSKLEFKVSAQNSWQCYEFTQINRICDANLWYKIVLQIHGCKLVTTNSWPKWLKGVQTEANCTMHGAVGEVVAAVWPESGFHKFAARNRT